MRKDWQQQLIVMREKYKENFEPGKPVEINLSRDDLANLIGTAGEQLGCFGVQEAGIIDQGRKIIVVDVGD